MSNRVDIAGGTLDIYPLYLLVPGSMTVNAAIALRSIATVRPVPGGARLVSGNFPGPLAARNTHAFPVDGALGLIARALRLYPPLRGVEIRVFNEAPFGSGLGGSSALLVAAMLALDAFLGTRPPWERTARLAMEVEAQHLRTLTGSQDHIAALRGGIQGIRYLPGHVDAGRIGPRAGAARELEARGVLASTRIAHRSGRVNWRMIRRALDGDARVLANFAAIAACAREAWEALTGGDVDSAAGAMAREWAIRRTLAPGVAPRAAERAFGARTFRNRVAGAKLCGAGAGGTAFCILKDPSDRGPVEAFLSDCGFEVRAFRLGGPPAVERERDGR